MMAGGLSVYGGGGGGSRGLILWLDFIKSDINNIVTYFYILGLKAVLDMILVFFGSRNNTLGSYCEDCAIYLRKVGVNKIHKVGRRGQMYSICSVTLGGYEEIIC